ncbi:MAG: cyclic nucleotide-binding domain-containing protein, partial [Actinobacteria bacterium]|nr:cyclic nucleotide-binding domain-containing protein [Actinomycetota bacterium]
MHAGPVAPDLTQRPGVRRLAGVPLLASCSAAELAAIAPLLRTERFKAGDELVAAGGREARFWIVVEGGAVIAAGERELGHLRPGDHYGEVGLLDGDPEPASVTATSPLLVLSCGKAGFDHILATAPGARSRVLVNAQRRRLAHRVADARPMPVLPRVVPPPPASMRRRVLLSLAATLAVVLVGTGVWFVSQRNHTTTFNLEDALSALHAGAGRPATASPQLQAPSATAAPSAAAPPDSSAASASATPAAAPVAGRGTASAATTAVPPASTA